MKKIREKELKRSILMEEIDQKNRGRTNTKDKNGGRGKLILETKIMIPKEPTEEEMKWFKKMSKTSKFDPRKDT